MVKAGDEALPDAGTAPPLHGVGVDVPVIEAAHDRRRAAALGAQTAKRTPPSTRWRTEEPMGPAMLAHVEEIDVEIGKGPEPGRVRWRLSVYRTATDHGLVGHLDLHVVRRRLSVYRTVDRSFAGSASHPRSVPGQSEAESETWLSIP